MNESKRHGLPEVGLRSHLTAVHRYGMPVIVNRSNEQLEALHAAEHQDMTTAIRQGVQPHDFDEQVERS
jgi:hypothetical protein